MQPPIPAYSGAEDYAFVCYAHADSAAVYPELERLTERGARFWYDEGIAPGSTWSDELAHAISGCARFLFFVSPRSIASDYCLDEINFALEHGRDVVCVYLEDTDLPPGLQLSLNRRQAINRTGLKANAFTDKLLNAATLSGGSTARMPAPAAMRRTRWLRLTLSTAAVTLVAAGIGFVWLDRIQQPQEPSLLILPFEALNLADESHTCQSHSTKS